jgi:hypothetical protein
VWGRKWLLGAALAVLGGCAETVAVSEWITIRPRYVDCSVAYAEPETCGGHGHSRATSVRGDAAASRPPNLNVATTCESAVAGASRLGGRSKQECLKEEHIAMDSVVKNWSQYASDKRIQCTQMTRNGGPPSYVELLTCLDITKDAAAIR